jgi:hypothetical protein
MNQLALVITRGNVPSDGTDEVEINNDTPCYSLCLEGCGCVEELKLWKVCEREEDERNVC